MTNLEIAHRFDETADLLELQEANPFRVRAYRNAARSLSDLTQSVADLAANSPQGLTALPGIGKDIAAKILQLVESGTFPLLEELRSQFPPGLLLLLHLPSVGPKKAAVLFRELQISSPEALKAAAEADQIASLKGFGKKSQQAMLDGLKQLEQGGRRALISDASTIGEAILSDLKTLECIGHASLAGSCRRRTESCGDLDLLITCADPDIPMDRLAAHPLVDSVLSRGRTKQRVRLKDGIELDLRVVPEESFGAALQYFTGSKEHNIAIRQRAIDRNLKINEYGVFRGEQLIAGQTEKDVYAAVGLPWIPPELRENRGEIELAEQAALPELVTLQDIRGDLHMHTTASDGKASIREMIEAARQRGLKYIAITDHSKRVSMANGLTAERLRQHWKDIRNIREEYDDIDVLLGIECDILEQAELDLPDDVLSEADWVLAVLHYGLRQPREQIMARLLNAIRNPYVCAIGHPSGRMVGRRPGADIDYPVLFKAAADHGVMLEINAHPSRLDLNDIHAAAARDHGIPIVIDTDAHSTTGLDVMHYGVDQARRARLTKKDVANTRTFKQFRRLLRTQS
jgi:DNA polymerase (family 10)